MKKKSIISKDSKEIILNIESKEQDALFFILEFFRT